MQWIAKNIFDGILFGLILIFILPDTALTLLDISLTLLLNIKLISISTEKVMGINKK